MKIELNSGALLPPGWSSQQAGEKSQVSTESQTGDRFTAAASGSLVKSLTAQAMKTPPMRQDKIGQLREAISSGSYKLDPHAIADAMIAGGE